MSFRVGGMDQANGGSCSVRDGDDMEKRRAAELEKQARETLSAVAASADASQQTSHAIEAIGNQVLANSNKVREEQGTSLHFWGIGLVSGLAAFYVATKVSGESPSVPLMSVNLQAVSKLTQSRIAPLRNGNNGDNVVDQLVAGSAAVAIVSSVGKAAIQSGCTIA